MGSAHVIAVSLGANPALLGSLVAAAGRWLCGGCRPICGDGCVLVHDAAEGPPGARVLRCWPGGAGTVEGGVCGMKRHEKMLETQQ